MTDSEYTPEDCLQAIREVAEELGHPPRRDEYAEARSSPSEWVIRSVLDTTFSEAREMAGVGVPQGGDGRKVALDVDYFEAIDDPAPAYWLGTLFGKSTVRTEDNPALVINSTAEESHFVVDFHDAIGAGYEIRRYRPEGQSEQVRFSVTNNTFIRHLNAVGLDDSARNVDQFPEITHALRPHFVRGFLEVRARIEAGSLTVSSKHRSKLETLAEWTEEMGAERTYIGELQSGRYSFRIGNVFDVTTVFEECFVGLDDSSILSERIAREWARAIREEHPYPENLSFVRDDPESSEATPETDARDGGAKTEGEGGGGESGVGGTSDTDGSDHQSVTVRGSWVIAVGDPSEAPSEILERSIEEYVAGLLDGAYPTADEVPTDNPGIPTVEVEVDFSVPLSAVIEAIVDDPSSPYNTLEELTAAALSDRLANGGASNLTVSADTDALLRHVGDGDSSAGAVEVLERTIAEKLQAD